MMRYSHYLKEFLKPLGIYDLSPGSLSASELDALGLGLDRISAAIDYTERESSLSTAESEGLDRREALFARAPVHVSVPLRRAAIAALLRIGEGEIGLDAKGKASGRGAYVCKDSACLKKARKWPLCTAKKTYMIFLWEIPVFLLLLWLERL